eukprot:2377505-Prymnesium_polylepis.2
MPSVEFSSRALLVGTFEKTEDGWMSPPSTNCGAGGEKEYGGSGACNRGGDGSEATQTTRIDPPREDHADRERPSPMYASHFFESLGHDASSPELLETPATSEA